MKDPDQGTTPRRLPSVRTRFSPACACDFKSSARQRTLAGALTALHHENPFTKLVPREKPVTLVRRRFSHSRDVESRAIRAARFSPTNFCNSTTREHFLRSSLVSRTGALPKQNSPTEPEPGPRALCGALGRRYACAYRLPERNRFRGTARDGFPRTSSGHAPLSRPRASYSWESWLVYRGA